LGPARWRRRLSFGILASEQTGEEAALSWLRHRHVPHSAAGITADDRKAAPKRDLAFWALEDFAMGLSGDTGGLSKANVGLADAVPRAVKPALTGTA
jgi:hypothetical protein